MQCNYHCYRDTRLLSEDRGLILWNLLASSLNNYILVLSVPLIALLASKLFCLWFNMVGSSAGPHRWWLSITEESWETWYREACGRHQRSPQGDARSYLSKTFLTLWGVISRSCTASETTRKEMLRESTVKPTRVTVWGPQSNCAQWDNSQKRRHESHIFPATLSNCCDSIGCHGINKHIAT